MAMNSSVPANIVRRIAQSLIHGTSDRRHHNHESTKELRAQGTEEAQQICTHLVASAAMPPSKLFDYNLLLTHERQVNAFRKKQESSQCPSAAPRE